MYGAASRLVQRGAIPTIADASSSPSIPNGLDAIATAETIPYRPPAAITTLTDEELNHLIGLLQRVVDVHASRE